MRRLTSYFNALLLGMILGMIFLALVHFAVLHRQEKICLSGFLTAAGHLMIPGEVAFLRVGELTLARLRSPIGTGTSSRWLCRCSL